MDKEIKGTLDLILNKLSTIDGRLDGIDSRLDGIDSRLDTMETRQDEIYQVVKAIEHSNQVHKAEIDNLNIRVSHTEGTLSAVGDAFNKRKVV